MGLAGKIAEDVSPWQEKAKNTRYDNIQKELS